MRNSWVFLLVFVVGSLYFITKECKPFHHKTECSDGSIVSKIDSLSQKDITINNEYDDETEIIDTPHYVKCIFHKQDPTRFWFNLSSTINHCSKSLDPWIHNRLVTLNAGYFDETKVFLDYRDSSKEIGSRLCRSMTVGIGNDIMAEKELKNKYPECQLYGLEPAQDQGSLFLNVGTYVPYGLSVEGGEINLTVREPNNKFSIQKMLTISMKQLVQLYTNNQPFHFAIMDIEGGEYTLLPQFHSDGLFSPDRGMPIFCQFDIEFHAFSRKQFIQSSTEFYEFMYAFITRSYFVPIAGKDYMKGDLTKKVTFLNTKAKICKQLFGK